MHRTFHILLLFISLLGCSNNNSSAKSVAQTDISTLEISPKLSGIEATKALILAIHAHDLNAMQKAIASQKILFKFRPKLDGENVLDAVLAEPTFFPKAWPLIKGPFAKTGEKSVEGIVSQSLTRLIEATDFPVAPNKYRLSVDGIANADPEIKGAKSGLQTALKTTISKWLKTVDGARKKWHQEFYDHTSVLALRESYKKALADQFEIECARADPDSKIVEFSKLFFFFRKDAEIKMDFRQFRNLEMAKCFSGYKGKTDTEIYSSTILKLANNDDIEATKAFSNIYSLYLSRLAKDGKFKSLSKSIAQVTSGKSNVSGENHILMGQRASIAKWTMESPYSEKWMKSDSGDKTAQIGSDLLSEALEKDILLDTAKSFLHTWLKSKNSVRFGPDGVVTVKYGLDRTEKGKLYSLIRKHFKTPSDLRAFANGTDILNITFPDVDTNGKPKINNYHIQGFPGDFPVESDMTLINHALSRMHNDDDVDELAEIQLFLDAGAIVEEPPPFAIELLDFKINELLAAENLDLAAMKKLNTWLRLGGNTWLSLKEKKISLRRKGKLFALIKKTWKMQKDLKIIFQRTGLLDLDYPFIRDNGDLITDINEVPDQKNHLYVPLVHLMWEVSEGPNTFNGIEETKNLFAAGATKNHIHIWGPLEVIVRTGIVNYGAMKKLAIIHLDQMGDIGNKIERIKTAVEDINKKYHKDLIDLLEEWLIDEEFLTAIFGSVSHETRVAFFAGNNGIDETTGIAFRAFANSLDKKDKLTEADYKNVESWLRTLTAAGAEYSDYVKEILRSVMRKFIRQQRGIKKISRNTLKTLVKIWHDPMINLAENSFDARILLGLYEVHDRQSVMKAAIRSAQSKNKMFRLGGFFRDLDFLRIIFNNDSLSDKELVDKLHREVLGEFFESKIRSDKNTIYLLNGILNLELTYVWATEGWNKYFGKEPVSFEHNELSIQNGSDEILNSIEEALVSLWRENEGNNLSENEQDDSGDEYF